MAIKLVELDQLCELKDFAILVKNNFTKYCDSQQKKQLSITLSWIGYLYQMINKVVTSIDEFDTTLNDVITLASIRLNYLHNQFNFTGQEEETLLLENKFAAIKSILDMTLEKYNNRDEYPIASLECKDECGSLDCADEKNASDDFFIDTRTFSEACRDAHQNNSKWTKIISACSATVTVLSLLYYAGAVGVIFGLSAPYAALAGVAVVATIYLVYNIYNYLKYPLQRVSANVAQTICHNKKRFNWGKKANSKIMTESTNSIEMELHKSLKNRVNDLEKMVQNKTKKLVTMEQTMNDEQQVFDKIQKENISLKIISSLLKDEKTRVLTENERLKRNSSLRELEFRKTEKELHASLNRLSITNGKLVSVKLNTDCNDNHLVNLSSK